MFGALVDASKRAELYGTTDQSIDPNRLVCRSRINILEASTPNLLIVQDPFVSLWRAPIPCLEHWWMPRAGLSFMALQTDRSIDPDVCLGSPVGELLGSHNTEEEVAHYRNHARVPWALYL